MRILVLGNNYSAKLFYDNFKKESSNIVFTTIKDEENYFEFNSGNDIVEFCLANEIDLVLITDEKYILSGVEEKLNEQGICVFAPSKKATRIVVSKAESKRFIHKNKIKTPKFFIAQKPQFAFDYIKENSYPFAIKPDRSTSFESTKFVETSKDAKKVINDLYSTGNEKVIIEDYIQGKSFEVWTLSTGYSAKIIGINAKYQNEVGYLKKSLINDEIQKEIFENVITPAINGFVLQNCEYMGILGFDFILSYDNQIFLTGFNMFFDEISTPLYVENYDWSKIMTDTIVGDVFMKNEFDFDNIFKLSYKENKTYETIEASTKDNLLRYIKELDITDRNVFEILRAWEKNA